MDQFTPVKMRIYTAEIFTTLMIYDNYYVLFVSPAEWIHLLL